MICYTLQLANQTVRIQLAMSLELSAKNHVNTKGSPQGYRRRSQGKEI